MHSNLCWMKFAMITIIMLVVLDMRFDLTGMLTAESYGPSVQSPGRGRRGAPVGRAIRPPQEHIGDELRGSGRDFSWGGRMRQASEATLYRGTGDIDEQYIKKWYRPRN